MVSGRWKPAGSPFIYGTWRIRPQPGLTEIRFWTWFSFSEAEFSTEPALLPRALQTPYSANLLKAIHILNWWSRFHWYFYNFGWPRFETLNSKNNHDFQPWRITSKHILIKHLDHKRRRLYAQKGTCLRVEKNEHFDKTQQNELNRWAIIWQSGTDSFTMLRLGT